MNRWIAAAGIVLLAGVAGCDRDPVGPIALAGTYELESAQGEAVPVRSFRVVSNEAGTCVHDLMSGALVFGGTSQYSLVFTSEVRCAGKAGVSIVHDQSSGTYARAGDELSLVPRAQGTLLMERLRLSPGAATLDIRMIGGERFRFRFVERRWG